MNGTTKLAFALLLPLAAASVASAVNFPTGTHLIKGTLKDWQNKVLTSSAAVTVQAVSTNGTVIASTTVADPLADGYNFLLQIPLCQLLRQFSCQSREGNYVDGIHGSTE